MCQKNTKQNRHVCVFEKVCCQTKYRLVYAAHRHVSVTTLQSLRAAVEK